MITLPSGTGTVVIRVDDQNDNSPRLARRLWELQVEETPSTAPPPNTTLLELTAADRDAHNTFLYRVSTGQGREGMRRIEGTQRKNKQQYTCGSLWVLYRDSGVCHTVRKNGCHKQS